MIWTFMGAWFALMLWQQLVYPQRTNKGYIGRFITWVVTKIVGPKTRTWRWFLTDVAVFVVVLSPPAILLDFVVESFIDVEFEGSAFILMMVKVLDDVLNGEDDGWKKRFLAVKNKIKWLWTPAMDTAKEGT